MKMVDNIDMSLDEIIKSNKPRRGVRRGGGVRSTLVGGRGGGGGRRGGGGARRTGGVQRGRGRGGITRQYTRGDVNSAWKHDLFEGYGTRKAAVAAARAAIQSTIGPTKLMIGNLDFGVSDSDIQELFAEFGPLKNASVHYDRSGRSLGTADVIFERRNDAIKAMNQYNGVPLDGRAMNIQLITSEIPTTTPARRTIATGAPRKFVQRGARGGGGGGGGVVGGAKGRPRGRGGRARIPRKVPTAEELDAELDAYSKEMK